MGKKWKALPQGPQSSTAQPSTAQPSTGQPSPDQLSPLQPSTAQHSTAQHSTAQHSTAQHSTALCVVTCTEVPACDKSFGEQQHGTQLWFAQHSNLVCASCERLVCENPSQLCVIRSSMPGMSGCTVSSLGNPSEGAGAPSQGSQ